MTRQGHGYALDEIPPLVERRQQLETREHAGQLESDGGHRGQSGASARFGDVFAT
jgi:hypothetical protein